MNGSTRRDGNVVAGAPEASPGTGRLEEWAGWFVRVLAGLLWLTATLKMISVLQGDPVLRWRDPVFQVPNRNLLVLGACAEWAVAAYAVWGRRLWRKVALIHGLAACWLVYRGLLKLSGFKGYDCPCLGPVVRDLPFEEGAWSVLLGWMAWGSFLGASLLLGAHAWRQARSNLEPGGDGAGSAGGG